MGKQAHKRPYSIDPDVARERAVKAGQASHSTDAYITRLINKAQSLTAEQRERLSVLLRPANTEDAA